MGDGADYAVLENEPGFDPVASGKVWTSPEQDPFLAGTAQRKVWLMTRDSIGADLLAEVAAALAATSLVFRNINATFSAEALLTAQKVYQFATINSNSPQSYCDFVPCGTNVTYNKQVLARPYVPPPPNKPVCYYISWPDKTCLIGTTVDMCTAKALTQKEVFTTRDACCNTMTNTGLWDALPSKAQGICAVPEGQFTCYEPDNSLRTCHEYQMDNVTGKGCTGAGLSVYPSSQVCCNALKQAGVIDATNDLPGTGACARINTDPTFTQCYVPVLNNATCVVLNGSDCATFGSLTAFNDMPGCCNDMIMTMQKLGFNKAGGIQLTTSGMCALYFSQATGPPTKRSRSLVARISGAVGRVAKSLLPALPAAEEEEEDEMLDVEDAFTYGLITAEDVARVKNAGAEEQPADGSLTLVGRVTEMVRRLASTHFASRRSLQQAPAPSSTVTTITVGTGTASPPVSKTLIPVDNSSFWHPPSLLPVGQCSDNACSFITVQDYKTVDFYKSTSVYDDLAWAAIWMYKATTNSLFLGQAETFLKNHYTDEVTDEVLISDRTAYVPSWNNVGWYVNTLLASITGQAQFRTRAEFVLTTWVFGNSVHLDTALPPATDKVNITAISTLTNVTDPSDNKTWVIVPQCVPSSSFESNCYDGVDNNCNGEIDQQDVDCGMVPVQYTQNNMAFSSAPATAPSTANAAFMAMMYAEAAPSSDTSTRLRCWALTQAAYMLGTKVRP